MTVPSRHFHPAGRGSLRLLPEALLADLRLYQQLVNGPMWKVVLSTEGTWVLITFRIGQHLRKMPPDSLTRRVLLRPLNFLHRLICLLTGISLPPATRVSPGFYIGHYGGIVIHEQTEIGPKCYISHGVTLGIGGRGEKRGVPRLGRGVYVGAGAVIIGRVTIGDYASIGANAVVTKDVPPKAVMVGVPAHIIGYREPAEDLQRDD